MNKTLFNAIQAKDFHTANEQFAQAMAQKMAVRLAAERKTVSEDFDTDNTMMESACPSCGKPFVGVYRDAGSDAQRKELRCKSCGATQVKEAAYGSEDGPPTFVGAHDEYKAKVAAKPKPAGFKVKCQECGKTFKTRSMLPDCPKCGGSDIDLAEAKKFNIPRPPKGPEMPNNWKAGFGAGSTLQPATGGSETPYLKDGRWVLYVYEPASGRKGLYDYGTDIVDWDDQRIDGPNPRVNESVDMALPLLTHSTVQAIYDRTGSASETELLCGVKNLVVSGSTVVSFVGVGLDGLMD